MGTRQSLGEAASEDMPSDDDAKGAFSGLYTLRDGGRTFIK